MSGQSLRSAADRSFGGGNRREGHRNPLETVENGLFYPVFGPDGAKIARVGAVLGGKIVPRLIGPGSAPVSPDSVRFLGDHVGIKPIRAGSRAVVANWPPGKTVTQSTTRPISVLLGPLEVGCRRTSKNLAEEFFSSPPGPEKRPAGRHYESLQRVSVHHRAVCTPTKEPGDGSGESTHRSC
jgi:hypothetical protein